MEPDRALAPLDRLVDAVQADLAVASRIASDRRLHRIGHVRQQAGPTLTATARELTRRRDRRSADGDTALSP
jgi:hypothetical protein